jgi:hypothetical protein
MLSHHASKLTDSIGHAVRENPTIILSCEADIMTGLNADDRQELKLGKSFDPLHLIAQFPLVVLTPLFMNSLKAGITKRWRVFPLTICTNAILTNVVGHCLTIIAFNYIHACRCKVINHIV